MRTWLAILGCVFGWADAGMAATLYVNGTGCSDATAKASNSAGSPWCTVYRAARGVAPGGGADSTTEAAAAGDTVLVAAGTYTAPGEGSRFAVAHNPANSGTSINPIIFQCVTNGACALGLSSGSGPVFGTDGRNFIYWIGFSVDEADALPVADTGPVVCNASTGVRFERNVITGSGYGHAWPDNHPGIRLEGCYIPIIRHNTISGFYTCTTAFPGGNCIVAGDPVNSANGAGIQLYESDDVRIENNTIFDCGSGVFVKGPTNGFSNATIIRKNLIYNVNNGIVLGGIANGRISQNAGYGITEFAIRWWTLSADASPLSTWVINNTFGVTDNPFGVQVGLYDTNTLSAGNRHENNIYFGGTYGNYGDNGASEPRYDSADRNVYYNWSSQFAVYSGGNQTLAAWRTAWSLDANTVTTDPGLVSGTDLRPCTGSGTPAVGCAGASGILTLGVDYLDLDLDGSTVDNIPAGAYVTGTETIGVEPEASGGTETGFGRLRLRL